MAPTTSSADTAIKPAAPSTNIVALPSRPEPVTPSEKALAFIKAHPVLVVAGGVAIGLAVSALLPKRASRKTANRAFRYAEAGASAVALFGKKTLDRAEDASEVASKRAGILAERAEKLSERALEKAEKLGIAALGTAGALGHAAAERAEKFSHVAADQSEKLGHVAAGGAEKLGSRASDRMSQFGNAALGQSSKLFGYPKPAAGLTDRILAKALQLKARARA